MNKTTSVAEASVSMDLNMHKGKSNILKYNMKNTNAITLVGETLEEVETFMYLSSIIDERGESDADIKARIGKIRFTEEVKDVKFIFVYDPSAAVGLNIHKGKSKVLRYNTACTNPITIDGEDLEYVKTFTYFGSIIDEQDGSDADVKARIGKARVAYLQLKNV
ncbi:unnamed protein product [Schistosoma margrebowiei]|uniref:Uncharacterized protein n=1 Tax=Schistosoma margrebowiei TaxID=48269 RepID=A0A183MJ90_9TREM|nr:unnamed protein product [Schistosoma margrebowiei]